MTDSRAIGRCRGDRGCSRNNYLQDVLPLEEDVRIGKVHSIITTGIHYEPILSIYVPLFVPHTLLGPSPPAPPGNTLHRVRLPWWQAKVEKVIQRLISSHLGV